VDDQRAGAAVVGLGAQGRNSYRVSLFDLSTDGCKVELVERASAGDRMSVKFEGLEVLEVDVCWANGPRAAGVQCAPLPASSLLAVP
jgi:hypothetical protein